MVSLISGLQHAEHHLPHIIDGFVNVL